MKLSEAARVTLTERLKVLVEKGEKYACGWEAGYKTAEEDFAGEVAQLESQNAELLLEKEALRLKAKHVAQSVNTIRGTMQLNREHKDLFGGAVYLVDHSHMWALVRNAEELDALLTGVDDEP